MFNEKQGKNSQTYAHGKAYCSLSGAMEALFRHADGQAEWKLPSEVNTGPVDLFSRCVPLTSICGQQEVMTNEFLAPIECRVHCPLFVVVRNLE